MKMKKKNFVLMAVAAGQKSTDGTEAIKRYIGVASSKILAVNPSKAVLEKLYNTTLEKDPEYLTSVERIDGDIKQDIPAVRINFIVKPTPEKCGGIEMITKASFFLSREPKVGTSTGNIQVIDIYGETAWVTPEELKTHAIPVYKNGKPANISSDYRTAYNGEEALTNFIKKLLAIPSSLIYNKDSNSFSRRTDNLKECECRLDKIENYFKGDFTELEAVINLLPDNELKLMYGVHTTEDNKQYQTVYTSMVLANSTRDYSRLEKDWIAKKEAGALKGHEYSINDLKEYVIKPTSFEELPSNTITASSGNNPKLPWE
jgi:hypothetical protein